MLAANSGWSNSQLRTQLQATAIDLGDPGLDPLFGHGLVDADEAAAPSGPTALAITGRIGSDAYYAGPIVQGGNCGCRGCCRPR